MGAKIRQSTLLKNSVLQTSYLNYNTLSKGTKLGEDNIVKRRKKKNESKESWKMLRQMEKGKSNAKTVI